MGRPGLKRGLSKRESAAMSKRMDDRAIRSDLDEARQEVARLEGVIEGKSEQIKLLKSLIKRQ